MSADWRNLEKAIAGRSNTWRNQLKFEIRGPNFEDEVEAAYTEILDGWIIFHEIDPDAPNVSAERPQVREVARFAESAVYSVKWVKDTASAGGGPASGWG